MMRRETVVVAVLIGLVLGFLGWANLVREGYGCPDEGHHWIIVQHQLAERSVVILFNNYGHLYFNVALAVLLPLSLFAPVTKMVALVTMRAVAFLFGWALVLLVYRELRRRAGLFGGVLGAGLLLGTPAIVTWSSMAHPDTMQAFFLTWALIVMGRGSGGWSLKAGLLAGAAMATKYGGVFLLPVILGLLVVDWWRERYGWVDSLGLQQGIRVIGVCVALLLLILAAVLSPEVVQYYLTDDGTFADPAFVGMVRTARGGAVGLAAGLLLLCSWGGLWGRIRWVGFGDNVLAPALVVVCAFTLAFLILSPCSWLRLGWVKGAIAEAQHIHYGHGVPGLPGGWRWLFVLFGGACAPVGLVSPSAPGILLAQGRKALKDRLWLACGGFLLVYGSFLYLAVNYRPARYLLPVLPVLAMMAVLALHTLEGKEPARG